MKQTETDRVRENERQRQRQRQTDKHSSKWNGSEKEVSTGTEEQSE